MSDLIVRKPPASALDVGRLAGVSTATVSRVLSNRGYVSAATRAAVQSAAETLGYVPNAVARSLKTQRSGFIAFIVPEITNDFYTTLSRGVEDVANSNGFHIMLGNTDENTVKEKSYIELMVANAVEGMIIAPSSTSSKSYRLLAERRIPTILVDRVVKGFVSDTVRSDDHKGAELLTRHLLDLGHQRIALINGHPETSVAIDRDRGYRVTLERAGIPYDPALVSWGPWFTEDAERRVETMLSSGIRPTAVIGANIFMTIGAIRAFRARGMTAPQDFALVSFNDLDLAAEIDPFLTVLSQPIYSIGRIAMGLLIDRIRNKATEPPRDVVLSPSLIVRKSCGTKAN
jgi:LacI family transcriptional regulator